jgi:hypothetical protein
VKTLSYAVANVLGGVVLVMLLIDPARPLLPVLVLLALAVLFFVLPRFLPPEKQSSASEQQDQEDGAKEPDAGNWL